VLEIEEYFACSYSLVRAHLASRVLQITWSNSDFCCFRGMTYVALTLCFKLRSFFYIDLHNDYTLSSIKLLRHRSLSQSRIVQCQGRRSSLSFCHDDDNARADSTGQFVALVVVWQLSKTGNRNCAPKINST